MYGGEIRRPQEVVVCVQGTEVDMDGQGRYGRYGQVC